MESADSLPGLTRADRLGLATFGSVLVHMVIILGVGFTVPKLADSLNTLPTLEITLVNTRSDEAPEQAEFLAQANQEGGGDSDASRIAKSPLPMKPTPSPSRALPAAKLATPPVPQPAEPITDVLTQDEEEARKLAARKAQEQKLREQQTESKPGVTVADRPRDERMRLSAEISRFWDEYQKRPRRKFLSARTKEHKYAAYMEACIIKAERVGNLNYPEQAKRRKLTGQVVLDVAIKPDGSLHEVAVIRPSGQKVLDDAAVRSVRLAAPFDPFPSEIRKEVDVLHITRTWYYRPDNRLVSR